MVCNLDNNVKSKEAERVLIARKTEEYLASGKKIDVVESFSTEEILRKSKIDIKRLSHSQMCGTANSRQYIRGYN